MGRRSIKSTKSGKYMNPTDQARKEARKKELKKNKKQRLLVRTTVLKNKDPGAIIEELDKLDEMEYNVNEPPQLAEKVLKDKRRKLKETLDRVMKLYQKDEPTYWNELRQIENDYERRRFHRIQFYEAVKQAEAVSNVEDIPLPPSNDMDTSTVPSIPSGEEIKDKPQPQGILKHSNAPVTIEAIPTQYLGPGGKEPPGVPPGIYPDLSSESESESEKEEEIEDGIPELPIEQANTDSDSISKDKDPPKPTKKSVRFEATSNEIDEMDRFMKEVEQEFKAMKEEDLNPPGVEIDKVKMPPPPPPPPQEAQVPPKLPQQSSSSAPVAVIPPQQPPPPGRPFFAPGSRPYFPFPPPPLGSMSMPPPPPRIRFNNRFRQPLRPPQPQPPSTLPSKPGESTKIVSEAMIQAKPQIRSLSADVTRFVPTAVKTRREDQSTTKEWKPAVSNPAPSFSKPKGPSKDDAYEDFMKEMQGLL